MRAGIGLLGREVELAELDRFLTGPGVSAVALRGDAGVGKTALTAELCARAAAAGWRVVRAIGVEAEKPFALGGLNQIVFGLREYVVDVDDHARDVLAPVLGADPVRASAPMALAIALLDLLAAAASHRPVLLAVDDVQWLDELSAAALSAAGRRASHPGVRILATYRPHADTAFSSAGWTEVPLGPLSAADAASIIDRMQMPLSAVAKRAILDVAAGNPLALEELPRCADQIDEWATSVPLTDRLVTVFGGRLRQLDERVRTELLRAALDGTKSSWPTNAGSDSGSRYVMQDVQAAIDQDLLMVNPLGDIVFRHPLVRAAVIHQARPDERRAAHAHLARLYDDVLVRRAAHLSGAATAPDQRVADLLDEAARLSIRRGGSAVAVDWLRRGAELSTDPSRRTELLADAAFVAAQAGRFDDAQAIADSVPVSGDEPVSSVLTAAYLALYRDGEVVTTHRRVLGALRNADAIDDPTLARLLKLLLAITMYAADPEAWRQTERAIDSLGARADGLVLIYRDSWGDTARRGHGVRTRLAEHLDGLPRLEPWEVMRLGVAAYYVDGLADFRSALRQLFERERDRGAVTNAMTMQHLLLLDQISAGHWNEALETGRAGLELTRVHHSELFGVQFTAYLGILAARMGEADEAGRCIATVTEWAEPRGLGLLMGYARQAAVLNALAAGDYSAAYTAAVRIGPAGEFPEYCYAALDGLLDLVEAAMHAGHHDLARAHAAAAAGLDLGGVSPRLAAMTLAARAMTAPDGEAEALFRAALAHPGTSTFPFEASRIRLAQGMWLRRQRRATQAREALTIAADGFAKLGARPWAERARNELRAAGATVKRHSGDAAALSAQERRIADLAAEGLSNKQIAAQLYLSPRTVGAHLYRIFPKLGVTSRAGLAQKLRARDQL